MRIPKEEPNTEDPKIYPKEDAEKNPISLKTSRKTLLFPKSPREINSTTVLDNLDKTKKFWY